MGCFTSTKQGEIDERGSKPKRRVIMMEYLYGSTTLDQEHSLLIVHCENPDAINSMYIQTIDSQFAS